MSVVTAKGADSRIQTAAERPRLSIPCSRGGSKFLQRCWRRDCAAGSSDVDSGWQLLWQQWLIMCLCLTLFPGFDDWKSVIESACRYMPSWTDSLHQNGYWFKSVWALCVRYPHLEQAPPVFMCACVCGALLSNLHLRAACVGCQCFQRVG